MYPWPASTVINTIPLVWFVLPSSSTLRLIPGFILFIFAGTFWSKLNILIIAAISSFHYYEVLRNNFLDFFRFRINSWEWIYGSGFKQFYWSWNVQNSQFACFLKLQPIWFLGALKIHSFYPLEIILYCSNYLSNQNLIL